jgi:hypothetical protein
MYLLIVDAEVDLLLLVKEMIHPDVLHANQNLESNGINFYICILGMRAKLNVKMYVVDEARNMSDSSDNPVQIAEYDVNIPQVHEEDSARSMLRFSVLTRKRSQRRSCPSQGTGY